MAKTSNYETLIRTVNESSSLGFSRGLGALFTEDDVLNGRQITLKGNKVINFGSCGYLGLELDPRLKEAAIEAVKKYGTLYASSRTYVSTGNYLELEELLAKIFNGHIVLTTNCSLGHHSVMPIIIGPNDMVIYDQQAHMSMHDLQYKLKFFGTEISLLRHNRLDDLEQKVSELKSKYEKIWYVVDGVFSMFGDLPNTKELIKLLNRHKNLYLYVDDAHGMSWAGPNGAGYTLSQTEQHPKMVIGTSIAKGFGACGGVFIFKEKEWRDKVKGWGGPLTYSGPQEPATIAAAIASAKIHLTDEIYEMQQALQEKISFTNHIIEHYKLPLVSNSNSPIFFIGVGMQRVAYNLGRRVLDDGFYTNISVYPAVPETCCGMRFTVTNHLTFEDIENLAKTVAHHMPKVLKEEERSMQDIYRAFRKFGDIEKRLGSAEAYIAPTVHSEKDDLILKIHHSIKEIDKSLWNNFFGDRGAYDYDVLSLFEEVFSNNSAKQDNWKFFYYLVEENGKVILATFFTSSLSKDDMFASAKVSAKVEELRKADPYHFTSTHFMMGSLLTNGDHLYIERENPSWKKAFLKLLNEVWKEFNNQKASMLLLRDFFAPDDELKVFLMDQGFIKLDIFENNVITDLKDLSFEEYWRTKLNKGRRHKLKSEVLENIEDFELKINQYEESQLEDFYQMYLNVKRKGLILNTFDLPSKLFKEISKTKNWDIVTVVYKPENRVVSMGICYKSEKNYSYMIFGIDNNIDPSFSVYKKAILFVVKRALELNVENLFLGITTNETKQKFGTSLIKQMGFVQVKDHFNQDYLNSLE